MFPLFVCTKNVVANILSVRHNANYRQHGLGLDDRDSIQYTVFTIGYPFGVCIASGCPRLVLDELVLQEVQGSLLSALVYHQTYHGRGRCAVQYQQPRR